MDVSIIIVSYNVRHFLEQCLHSVYRSDGDLLIEVIVIDNASEDDSAEMVKSRFPQVRFIQNKDNTGFAKANNQAINLATGKHILLLNPDTVLGEKVLETCFQFMETHADAGALGVRMIDGAGRFLPESKRGFPTPMVAFFKAFGLSRLFPGSAYFNRYYLGHLNLPNPFRIDVLAGAFMWIRREALNKSGLLDERFFMYGEDIDLSYRLAQNNFHNYYLPQTTIIHYKGESTKKGTLNYIRIFYQAMILFADKYFKGSSRSMYLFMIRIAVYFRAALSLVKRIIQDRGQLILDALVILAGVIGARDYWAVYYFNKPDYYAEVFNLPMALSYTGILMIGLVLSGAYDKKYDLWPAIRGVIIGTVLLAAIYGFLPMTYRTSRAIIALSALWAMGAVVFLRAASYYLKYGRWNSIHHSQSRLMVIGREDECVRAGNLLQSMGLRKNLIGWVTPDTIQQNPKFIGTADQLEQVVAMFEVKEIIFCSKDIHYGDIIRWIESLGSGLQYRILPEAGQSFIGSDSADQSGELYTLDVVFEIADPLKSRHKKLISFMTGLLGLLLSPVLIWGQKNKFAYLRNMIALLIGQRTLVGIDAFKHPLIQVKSGILNPEDAHPDLATAPDLRERLHYIYARDYQPAQDIRILLRNMNRLDRAQK